jgi:hypothetical protein
VQVLAQGLVPVLVLAQLQGLERAQELERAQVRAQGQVPVQQA